MEIYQSIDPELINSLEKKHEWLIKPLYTACNYMMETPFFAAINSFTTAADFAPIAKQLYYHSVTFPRIISLMLALMPYKSRDMMPFLSQHIHGEADHYQLLASWMLKHNIIKTVEELDAVFLTPETNACINLGYQLAIEQDIDKWVVAMNCGIERCSNLFFANVASKMHVIAAGDIYFDIHVEADQHHSIWGLQYIEPMDSTSLRTKKLIAVTLEAVGLWIAMLHSWIGVSLHPHFSLDGHPIRT